MAGCPRTCRQSTAHPRSRGEHGRLSEDVSPIHGSSPLARGTWASLPKRFVTRRLIPARAGNICQSDSRQCRLPAHPRSRGEHTWCSEPHSAKAAQPRLRWEHTELSLHDFFKRGSSPLTRGTLARPSGRSAVHGLIPARAGNTRCRSRCHGYWWAHPRSRGEHRTLTLPRLPAEGSSPLARGTF